MKLGLESERRMINRSIQRDLKYRWPNSKVPYRIEAAVNTAKRLVIASVNLVVIHVKTFSWLTIFFQAIKNIEDNTCIRFVDKVGSDLDWLDIYTTGADGCFANTQ